MLLVSLHKYRCNISFIKRNLKEQIILGVDPGTSITGYGIIKSNSKNIEMIDMGVIHLTKSDDHPMKLKKIFESVLALIEKHNPDFLAIEAPFYGKNVQSMLKLGRAQGVCIAAALYRSIPVQEYSPKKIKQSITGNGNASKEQVSSMLQNILNFKGHPEFLDATDGLAAAVCHHIQNGKPDLQNNKSKINKKKSKGWSAFLTENPDKIIKG